MHLPNGGAGAVAEDVAEQEEEGAPQGVEDGVDALGLVARPPGLEVALHDDDLGVRVDGDELVGEGRRDVRYDLVLEGIVLSAFPFSP